MEGEMRQKPIPPMPEGFKDYSAWMAVHWEFSAQTPTRPGMSTLDHTVMQWQRENQERVLAAIKAQGDTMTTGHASRAEPEILCDICARPGTIINGLRRCEEHKDMPRSVHHDDWRLEYADITDTHFTCLCCGEEWVIADHLRDWDHMQAMTCDFCGAMFEYGARTGYRISCGTGIPPFQHVHADHQKGHTNAGV